MSAFQASVQSVEKPKADKQNYFNYQDSIKAYLTLGKTARLIKDAEDAYGFYPLEKALAGQYYTVAYQLSRGKYNSRQLNQSIIYYKKAKAWYLAKQKDYQRAARCDKGIDYATYRLQRKR